MPAPAPLPRELSITYDGVTVGGTNEHYLLDSYYRYVRSWNHAYVEFDVIVKGASEPDFASRCATLEAAFSDPDHALVVQLGSSSLVAYSAAPKDYCRPTITKSADPAKDSGRSRGYVVRVDIDPAATQLSPSGLREVTVDVAYSPARRRTVTLAGLWTATGSDGSRDAYEAGIESYASARLAELTGGGTFELAEEPQTSRDRPDHLISFRRVYLERLWQEGGASFNDPDIVRQSAIFRRRRVAPGDSPKAAKVSGDGAPIGNNDTSSPPATPGGVQRLTTIDVQYSAWIDKGVTNLVSKWESIRDWLLDVVSQDFFGGFALVEESPALDYDENRITASLVVVGSEGGSIHEQAITVTTNINEDEVLVPAWTGDPYSCYPYVGQRILTRTCSIRAVVRGSLDDETARSMIRKTWQGGVPKEATGGGQWTRGVVSGSATPKTLGLGMDGGHEYPTTEIQGSITRRYFKKVENGKGGGGSSGGGTPLAPPTQTPGSGGARAVFSG